MPISPVPTAAATSVDGVVAAAEQEVRHRRVDERGVDHDPEEERVARLLLEVQRPPDEEDAPEAPHVLSETSVT